MTLCSEGNESSCDTWVTWCDFGSYCDCMEMLDDEAWCTMQFPPVTFCVGVEECQVASVSVSGPSSADISDAPIEFSAQGFTQGGSPINGNGTWTWSTTNGTISGNGATGYLYPALAGNAQVTATFQESTQNCDPVSGSKSVNITDLCAPISISVSGPSIVWAGSGQQSYFATTDPIQSGWFEWSLSNPAAGTLNCASNTCVFTPGSTGQWTQVMVGFIPASGCPAVATSMTTAVVKLEVLANGAVINDNAYVEITSNPSMPEIVTRLRPDGLPGNANWNFLVQYLRPNRTDEEPFSWNVAASSPLNFTSQLQGDILGGRETFAVNYFGAQSFVFHVRGNNPTASQVGMYGPVSSGPWFTMAMIRHESTTECVSNEIRQFNPTPAPGPNWEDYGKCPNRSPDFGWGMMQLTNPPATRRQLWDWQSNATGGLSLLEQKRIQAQTSWNQSVSRFNQYNLDNPEAQVPPPPNHDEVCVTFSYAPVGSQRSFFDAVWIKRYNGNTGGGDYYKWNENTNQWEPHFTNSENPPFNYVNRISTTYCECGQ